MPRRYKKKKYQRRGVSRAQVQQMIASNQETKFLTHSWNAVGVQDSGRTPIDQNLNDCATGNATNQRDGHQIRCTGLYGRFVVTGADATNIVRVILYMPKDPTDSLTTAGIGVATLVDADRFTVLSDKYYSTTSGGANTRVFTLARKWSKGTRKGIQTQFYGGATGNCSKNLLKLYMVGDSGAVSDPTITGHLRCYFKDA